MAAGTPRKRTPTTRPGGPARRPAKKTTAAAVIDDNFEPLRFSTSAPAPETERTVVFYVDDTEYSTPKEVPPVLALKFLDIINNEEDDDRALPKAIAMAFDGLFGEGALSALAKCDSITPEQFGQLTDFVQRKMFSATEGMTGN